MNSQKNIEGMTATPGFALPVQPGIDGNLRIYAADKCGTDSGLLATVHKGREALDYIVEAINSHERLKACEAKLKSMKNLQGGAIPEGWEITFNGDLYGIIRPDGRGVYARRKPAFGISNTHERFLAGLASALINAPVANNSPWVDCNDHLPKEDGCYDIWHANGGRWIDAYFFQGTWLRSPEPPGKAFDDGEVTHWMEQPGRPA